VSSQYLDRETLSLVPHYFRSQVVFDCWFHGILFHQNILYFNVDKKASLLGDPDPLPGPCPRTPMVEFRPYSLLCPPNYGNAYTQSNMCRRSEDKQLTYSNNIAWADFISISLTTITQYCKTLLVSINASMITFMIEYKKSHHCLIMELSIKHCHENTVQYYKCQQLAH